MNQLNICLLFCGVYLLAASCEAQQISAFHQIKSPKLYDCYAGAAINNTDFKAKPVKRFGHFVNESVLQMTHCSTEINDRLFDGYHSLGLNISWVIPPQHIDGNWVWLNVSRFHIAFIKSQPGIGEIKEAYKIKVPKKRKNPYTPKIVFNQINLYSMNICNYVLPEEVFRVEVYARFVGNSGHQLVCRETVTVPDCCSEVGRKASLCRYAPCEEIIPTLTKDY